MFVALLPATGVARVRTPPPQKCDASQREKARLCRRPPETFFSGVP